MCFLFTWVFNPIIASFVSSADFTFTARMAASFKENILVYVVSGVVTVLGVLLLIFSGKLTWEGIPGVISAAGNVFGLVVVVLLLAYGLVDVPRSIWRYSDLDAWSLHATKKVGKLHKKVEEAMSELKISAALAANMSKLISKRDSLRKYVDQINEEISGAIPLSAVQDVEFGDLDLDYELDHEGMVSLRKRCQRAVIVFHRSKYQYTKLVKSVQFTRDRLAHLQETGAHTQLLAREVGLKTLAVFCNILSAGIIMAEATLFLGTSLPYSDTFSVISMLLKVCNENIVGTYSMILVFLLYFCSCTYHSLLKMKIFSYYYLVPNYTDSYSLLLNASMLARFTAPLCYNFITLTKLKHTALTDSALAPMGKVPFFGRDFNLYYPIMGCVFYFAVAFNFWGRLIKAFRWVTFSSSLNFDDEEDEDDQSDFLTRGQSAVYRADTALLDFDSIGEGGHGNGAGPREDSFTSSEKGQKKHRELDTDERWRQAQERMREKRGASSGRSAARSTGTGRDTSAGQNSTTSEKLDSIFKGLLS